MKKLLLTLFYTFYSLKLSVTIEISEFIGPTSLRNGSKPLLVLDCPYTLESKEEENGLEVKWYYNKVPFPIYQWIPGNRPQDLIFFKGRVDISYEASEDPLSKHRALAILKPTTELTAEYTCRVSSFQSDDFRTQHVIIYSPASDISLTYRMPTPDSAIVSCHADGLFPEPKMFLYKGNINSERTLVENISTHIKKDPHKGHFNATVQFQFFDDDIKNEEVFICVITLPGTDYSIQEEVIFYRDQAMMSSGTEKTTSYKEFFILILYIGIAIHSCISKGSSLR